ncbi:MAG: hypothetical protein KAU24_03955 [Candidatus Aenigmarchaeota archaeon]|nr:hypothetical protein [Candidatus Aenigmarchaeota archaeon]
MTDIVEILKQLAGKESEIELDLNDIKLGTEHVKIGLGGKVRLRLVHLQDSKPVKSK